MPLRAYQGRKMHWAMHICTCSSGTCFYSVCRVHTSMLMGPGLFSGGVREIPPCLDAFAAVTYLNRVAVQDALHVKHLKWDICSDTLRSVVCSKSLDGVVQQECSSPL